MKKNKLFAVGLVLAIGLFFTIGCFGLFGEDEVEIPENGVPENGEQTEEDNGEEHEDLTGTATYSGTWTGSLMGEENSGTWEFEVDFDAGDVSGWFEGDSAGDISGSVSDGVISAEGDAAMGTVTWSGTFSADGSELSGDWEFADGLGSGTWQGTEGEADDEDNGEDNGDNGEDEEVWCEEGTEWEFTDYEEGEEISMEIEGLAEYDGEEMCKAVYTVEEEGEEFRMNYYFTEDEEKVCYEMIDPDTGMVMQEMCM